LIDRPSGQESHSFFEQFKTAFDKNSLAFVPRPLSSLDLAPPDFWFFGHIKTCLEDRVFNDVDDLLETVIEF
jgi:hypothetical protein